MIAHIQHMPHLHGHELTVIIVAMVIITIGGLVIGRMFKR